MISHNGSIDDAALILIRSRRVPNSTNHHTLKGLFGDMACDILEDFHAARRRVKHTPAAQMMFVRFQGQGIASPDVVLTVSNKRHTNITS